jgi:nitrate/TMAO reductase-like tetraheme cytochrome c subunit
MKMPKSVSNWISIIGGVLAINSFILIIILFLESLITSHENPYNGMFTYIILPVILIIGLIMIPIGMFIRRRKIRKEGEPKWPVLDMNSSRQRHKLLLFSIFTFLFLIVSAVGSYEAFNFTESVTFCGKLCHKVMEPEYTTYLHSPHARVACVECHVGEGADWYVKSKLSGLYQVYSVIFHKYSQPIGTPIKNLRPARETCERCHWPEKFYSPKLDNRRTYLTDSLNTEWNVSMLVKTSPNYNTMGLSGGIHWHINKDVRIEYVASTKDRESIPWVKFTNLKTGDVQIFQDTENRLTQKALDTLEHRIMDCMDCHNRPSHSYKSALAYVDEGMMRGEIPVELPFIKKVAMNVLKGPFTNKDSSFKYISDSINNFYKTKFPDIYAGKKSQIDKAIAGIENEFSLNTFPYMRASSTSYLNHIGHLESDGCFRCHSDRHVSKTGKVISKDCNLCHTFVLQGSSDKLQYGTFDKPMDFIHPVDVKNNWKTYFCTECHRTLYP